METEDLILDERSKGEVVKEVGKVFPDIGIAVFSQTFVVKPIHLCDLARLMVSSEDGDALGVANLEAD